MNIQADISWLQSEIASIKDPNLLEALKSMVRYKNNRVELGFGNVLTKAKFVNDIKEAELQIEKGDYLSIDDFEKESNQWK